MRTLAIRVDALGKCYMLSGPQPRYLTLRESMATSAVHVVRTMRRAMSRRARTPEDESRALWALENVSFEVEPGEIVGVIGGNGAGKSTLLKILSRITAPTVGRAEVCGRVGSLLEVGTGFHPELTGRENIVLNGAILGMRHAEIQRRFDAIVAFAEVERFIDTPVKRYSSGMYLRLAFAVAAHLTPDIFLIDEVLAVGDGAFQKKCLGKMSDVARDGRTILFVSHNVAAVQGLCERVIWLQQGRVKRIGPAHAMVSEYLRESLPTYGERTWPDMETAPGNESLRIRRGGIRRDGDQHTALCVRTPFAVEIDYWNLCEGARLTLNLNVYNEQGVLLFSGGPSHQQVYGGRPLPCALLRDACHVPGDLLNDGLHRVELYVMRGNDVIFHDADFLSFTVADSPQLRADWFGKWSGAVRPNLRWVTTALTLGPAPGRNQS
jgi:lipopolysaccharide transport system ATP-binding protein